MRLASGALVSMYAIKSILLDNPALFDTVKRKGLE